ncbi:MAG: YafY family transcriptional regulator [Rhodobacteraceae bacterium]|nr:YafY family transcriptional regulator [Paracoccaceae bacterium]
MRRSDRLFDILDILRDGHTHRASDIAARTGVSVRTVYRDMDWLAASEFPVSGTRGTGYRMAREVALPPLSLSEAELDALNLGVAIVAEAGDPDLKAAALRLAEKIDAALPTEAIPAVAQWKTAVSPFANAARGLGHRAVLRTAIKTRQKLRLTYCDPEGRITARRVRPLRMAYAHRAWILTAWCEMRGDFREFRIDLIEAADPLPELFVDEPGRTLADYRG